MNLAFHKKSEMNGSLSQLNLNDDIVLKGLTLKAP
jgi:hypothetical protein